ncbi:hypothetical protein [Lysinibacillus sp. 3P01SB]|uniref:hypothetical protein n=1 Tax=Lysinibacillus sp. 3P01SB TaxID=3132284 RepID=UPI0039A61E05
MATKLATFPSGALVRVGAKVSKGAINIGKKVVGQVKNVFHPDKVKEVYDDYIKSSR